MLAFSNGGACAELLAATRPGARGAILMHAPLPIRDLGWTAWPATVPVEVHFAEKDPLRNEEVITHWLPGRDCPEPHSGGTTTSARDISSLTPACPDTMAMRPISCFSVFSNFSKH